ncbi:MAG: alpha/beta hydrolase [Paracoccaceae bacterium]
MKQGEDLTEAVGVQRAVRRGRIVDQHLLSGPSVAGAVFAALAFVAALLPGMVPRSELGQGILAGFAVSFGYWIGAGLAALARMLGAGEDTAQDGAKARAIGFADFGLAVGLVAYGLWFLPTWANSARAAMQLPPVETVHRLFVLMLTMSVGLVLVMLGRVFRRAAIIAANVLLVILPVRVALILGLVLASGLFWSIGSGVLVRGAVDGMDAAYAQMDALIPPGSVPPDDPLKSGGLGSHVRWDSLGAQGRDFVQAPPGQADIAALRQGDALEPVRVYIGVNSAEGPAARAALALQELIRTGAFQRRYLVIATPTGTGWVDPAAIMPLEYLLRGDVATVSVQYSYLPSWLSLLVEPDRGVETARQVFRTIYGYWSALPADDRPRLYLFGLSLGALNSDLSVDVYDIMADPYHGALWAGPPFPSRTWNVVVKARNPDSSVWHPRYSDGRMFRFMTQDDGADITYGPWGPLRVVYLQYPSDPIVFFETGSLLRRPAIMSPPRPPDVSEGLVWVPVISFLQSIVDMVTAAGTPAGFGHVYAGNDYLDGWLALLEPHGATAAEIARIRERLVQEGL